MDGDIGKAMPLVIFGALSFVAGLLSIVLPETLGFRLPDTINDAKQFGRYCELGTKFRGFRSTKSSTYKKGFSV